MKLKFKLILCLISLCQVISLLLIFLGVVGNPELGGGRTVIQNQDEKHLAQEPGSSSSPDQVVLIIIDALRVDMMSSKQFPFLLGSTKNHKNVGVFRYNLTVDSPTVTLPRIKTLVIGKAPTYLDILKNFQTSDNSYSSNKIVQDNVISSLRTNRPDVAICFFGDETWLRLFPPEKKGDSKYFKKWEGVTSFYVKDFYQVDINVTKHLDEIDECGFLILHYLGLDHIGHVHGPSGRPDLILSKLKEMDAVVQKIFFKIQKKKKKSVILVTGDHGMANGGGHGGSSLEEITTPLVAVISGFPNIKQKSRTYVNQVDIAPTLASLWSLKVPEESKGKIILDIVQPFQSNQKLAEMYQYNCEHLMRMLGDSNQAAKYRVWLNEISKMDKPLSIKKYIELETELAAVLKSLKTEAGAFSTSYVCGFILLIVCEVTLVFFIIQKLSIDWIDMYSVVFLSFVTPTMLYFSSSFIEEEHYVRYFLFSCLILYYYCSAYPLDYLSTVFLLKILCCHRLLFSFNQTGDKWNNLKDVNDWIAEEKLVWISALCGSLLVWRFLLKTQRNSVFCGFTLGVLYISKFLSYYDGISPIKNIDEILIQKFVYLLMLFNFVTTRRYYSWRSAIFQTFLLLILNLQRFQNLLVVGLVLSLMLEVISFFHHQYYLQFHSKDVLRSSLISQIVFIWLSTCAFFYQGNSNGLSTIDVSAGYIGIGSFFSSGVIGLLIFFNTYGNPLLVFMHFLTLNDCESKVSNTDRVGKTMLGLDRHSKISNPLPVVALLSNGAEGIIYSVTLLLFRNHLFIWSVFVPKLMYLCAQSVMHLFLSITNVFV